MRFDLYSSCPACFLPALLGGDLITAVFCFSFSPVVSLSTLMFCRSPGFLQGNNWWALFWSQGTETAAPRAPLTGRRQAGATLGHRPRHMTLPASSSRVLPPERVVPFLHHLLIPSPAFCRGCFPQSSQTTCPFFSRPFLL